MFVHDDRNLEPSRRQQQQHIGFIAKADHDVEFRAARKGSQQPNSSRIIGRAVPPVLRWNIQSQGHPLDSLVNWIKVRVTGIDRQQSDLLAASSPLVYQRRRYSLSAANLQREDYESDSQVVSVNVQAALSLRTHRLSEKRASIGIGRTVRSWELSVCRIILSIAEPLPEL